jgi:hypothetical protein
VPRVTMKTNKSLENGNEVHALENVLRSADSLLVVEQMIGDIGESTHHDMQIQMIQMVLENKCQIQQLQEEIANLKLEHKRQMQEQSFTQEEHGKKEDFPKVTNSKPTSMMTRKELSKKSSTTCDIGEEEKKEDYDHEYLNEHVVFCDTDSAMQSSYQYGCFQQQEQDDMPHHLLEQTQLRAGKLSVVEEDMKEGISDNANWNDNDDEFENVVFCDTDGGVQPYVPQQSQPPPEPPLLLSAGNLLRRHHRAPSRNKGASPNVGIFSTHSNWRRRLSSASEQENQLGAQHMHSMRQEEVEDGIKIIFV